MALERGFSAWRRDGGTRLSAQSGTLWALGGLLGAMHVQGWRFAGLGWSARAGAAIASGAVKARPSGPSGASREAVVLTVAGRWSYGPSFASPEPFSQNTFAAKKRLRHAGLT